MIHLRAVLLLLAGVLAGSPASASSCEHLGPTIFVVSIKEQPITRRQDLSLATLNALSAQAQHRSAHATLGFYAATVGFVAPRVAMLPGLSSTANRPASCPRFEVRTELTAVERHIAIASDLLRTPCLFRAAIAHYQHHADTASRALRRFAAGLPTALGPEVDRFIRSSHAPLRTPDDKLHAFITDLLTRSMAAFSESLPAVQDDVDSPAEVRSLAPCNDI